MNNIEKYNQIFMNVLEVKQDDLNDELTFVALERWDSLAHITLITELEDIFEIIFETQDILNFGSYENGKILLEKYGVSMEG